MSQKSLAALIRQSIMDGMTLECVSMIYNIRKDEILEILQEKFTLARAQKLFMRLTENKDFSMFVDETIGDDIFYEIDGKPIIYSTLLGSDVVAMKLKFKITGIVNMNNLKENVEYFSKNEWLIIAKIASNELGLCFGIFGPNQDGTKMELKSTDEVSAKIINQFLRKAFNNLCDK